MVFKENQSEEKVFHKFKKRFRSLDGMFDALAFMIDFDRDRLQHTLFEYACKTLEKEGFNPKENARGISLFMRIKLLDVGKKAYEAYSKRQSRLSLDSRYDDLNYLVEYEQREGKNSTYPWVVRDSASVQNKFSLISR